MGKSKRTHSPLNQVVMAGKKAFRVTFSCHELLPLFLNLEFPAFNSRSSKLLYSTYNYGLKNTFFVQSSLDGPGRLCDALQSAETARCKQQSGRLGGNGAGCEGRGQSVRTT